MSRWRPRRADDPRRADLKRRHLARFLSSAMRRHAQIYQLCADLRELWRAPIAAYSGGNARGTVSERRLRNVIPKGLDVVLSIPGR